MRSFERSFGRSPAAGFSYKIRRYCEKYLHCHGIEATCPHYLTLTNDDLLERGYRLKMALR